jgi:hypothetical protein
VRAGEGRGIKQMGGHQRRTTRRVPSAIAPIVLVIRSRSHRSCAFPGPRSAILMNIMDAYVEKIQNCRLKCRAAMDESPTTDPAVR